MWIYWKGEEAKVNNVKTICKAGNTVCFAHGAKISRCLSYVDVWLIPNKWVLRQLKRTGVQTRNKSVWTHYPNHKPPLISAAHSGDTITHTNAGLNHFARKHLLFLLFNIFPSTECIVEHVLFYWRFVVGYVVDSKHLIKYSGCMSWLQIVSQQCTDNILLSLSRPLYYCNQWSALTYKCKLFFVVSIYFIYFIPHILCYMQSERHFILSFNTVCV